MSLTEPLNNSTPHKEYVTLDLSYTTSKDDVEYSTPKNYLSNFHKKSMEQAIYSISWQETSHILVVLSLACVSDSMIE